MYQSREHVKDHLKISEAEHANGRSSVNEIARTIFSPPTNMQSSPNTMSKKCLFPYSKPADGRQYAAAANPIHNFKMSTN